MKAVTVSEYMTRQLVTFTPETSLYEAMGVMLERRISGAPVVDDAGAILGVISEIDFLDAMLKGAYYGQLEGAVGDYMTQGAETIDAQMDLYEAAKLFIGARRRRLPVVDGGRLVGQLSRRDLLRAIRDWSTSGS